MALPAKQTLAFPLTAGVDETPGDELVSPPALLSATNVVWDGAGQVRPREGFELLAGDNHQLSPGMDTSGNAYVPEAWLFKLNACNGTIYKTVDQAASYVEGLTTSNWILPPRTYSGEPSSWTGDNWRWNADHSADSLQHMFAQRSSVFSRREVSTARVVTDTNDVPDVAFVSNVVGGSYQFYVYAYTKPDPTASYRPQLFVSVQEAGTGAFVYRDRLVTTDTSLSMAYPKVIRLSDTVAAVLCQSTSGNNLYYAPVTLTSISDTSHGVGSTVTVSNVSSSTRVDVSPYHSLASGTPGTIEGALVIYQNSSNSDLYLYGINAGGTAASFNTNVLTLGAITASGLAVWAGDGTDRVFISYTDMAVPRTYCGTATLSPTAGPFTSVGAVTAATLTDPISGTGSVIVTIIGNQTSNHVIALDRAIYTFNHITTTAHVSYLATYVVNTSRTVTATFQNGSGAHLLTSTYIASKPLAWKGGYFQLFVSQYATQLTYHLVEIGAQLTGDAERGEQSLIEICRVAPLQAKQYSSGYTPTVIPRLEQSGSNEYPYAISTVILLADGSVDKVDFVYSAGRHVGRAVKANNDEYVSPGGVPYIVGKTYLTEVGFPDAPGYQYALNSGIASAVTTHPTSSTTYGCAVVWKTVTPDGRIIRSAPKAFTSTNSGVTNQSLTWGGTSQWLSSKRVLAGEAAALPFPIVEGEFYRTTSSGVDYYKVATSVASIGRSNNGGPGQEDNDDSITSFERLYTYGGVLQNDPPPSCRFAFNHQGRIWLVGCDDPTQVWISKPPEEGMSVSFSADLVLTTPEPVIAGVSSGGVAYLIGESNVFAVPGDPPDATGGGGSIRNVDALSLSFTFNNVNSVLQVPEGFFFQVGDVASGSGRLCFFNGSTIDTVEAVRSYFESNDILSTAYDAGRNQAYFLTNTFIAVYNTKYKTWCKWTCSRWTHGFGDMVFDDSSGYLYVAPYWTYNTTGSGELLRWPGTSTIDHPESSPAYVNWTVRSGWLRTGGILGFQRVWKARLLGKFVENTDISVSEYTDNSTTANQTVTYDYLDGGDGASAGVKQLELYVKNQRCESISIEVSGSAPESAYTTGEGFKLAAIAFEVGVEPGMNRGKASERH